MKCKLTLVLIFLACMVQIIYSQNNVKKHPAEENKNQTRTDRVKYKEMLNSYVTIKLKTGLDHLSANEKQLLPLLFEASGIIDELFWNQTFGNKEELLRKINNEDELKLVMINYGPWDRLDGNKSFVNGYSEKFPGANYYPPDMTKDEFEKFNSDDKTSLYTLILRKDDGRLVTIPYNKAYAPQLERAARLLKEASGLAEDGGLKNYLALRASALLTDNYFDSDMAWMDMKNNNIDYIIGPIENYDDELFGYKTAYESFILIKDRKWSSLLEKYNALLPILQSELPVNEMYKKETPGSNSDLGVYDAIFYSGDCNAGSKTIAINLPNDEKVQLQKGSRKLQLKNVMQAKFDYILLPIANLMIDPSQRKHIKFDAFFQNIMFHEVAHGLGVKNLISGHGTVRQALKEQYSWLEESKADVLGLFLVTTLKEMGEIETDLMDNYVTFVAGIFRSVRFGASSAHAKANLVRFNYFVEKQAIILNPDGRYKINFDKMKDAVISLSGLILTMQGDGDYNKVKDMIEKMGIIGKQLQTDLNRIKSENIPVDVIFEQGVKDAGL
jgi:hypothetical protein